MALNDFVLKWITEKSSFILKLIYYSILFQLSSVTDLWTFINLNLAIVYLRQNKAPELMALLERIDPERVTAR